MCLQKDNEWNKCIGCDIIISLLHNCKKLKLQIFRVVKLFVFVNKSIDFGIRLTGA